MRRLIGAAALALLGGVAVRAAEPSPAPVAVHQANEISGRAGQAMVAACLDRADKEGWKVQVAVLDRSGALVAFGRSDDAVPGSYDLAMGKARTSVSLGAPSGAMGEFAWGKDGHTPTMASALPGLMPFPGGLPVRDAQGHLLGAIGASGASGPDGDLTCAQAGLDRFTAMLGR